MAVMCWKFCNFVIGLLSFGLGIYNYTRTSSSLITVIDTVAIIFTSLAVAETAIFMICYNQPGDSCCFACYKCCWCIVLNITGAAILFEAFTFWQEDHPSCFQDHKNFAKECQFTELRIGFGVLMCVNGLVYLLVSPPRRPPAHARIVGPQSIHVPSELPGPGRRATDVTTNSNITSASDRRNPGVTQPLISANRPESSFQRTSQDPYANAQRPPVPSEFHWPQPAYAPTAPSPVYMDYPPPPYSTLPPNTQLRGPGW